MRPKDAHSRADRHNLQGKTEARQQAAMYCPLPKRPVWRNGSAFQQFPRLPASSAPRSALLDLLCAPARHTEAHHSSSTAHMQTSVPTESSGHQTPIQTKQQMHQTEHPQSGAVGTITNRETCIMHPQPRTLKSTLDHYHDSETHTCHSHERHTCNSLQGKPTACLYRPNQYQR